MDISEIRKLSMLEDTYWWFVGRRAIVASILERYLGGVDQKLNILDFGSGTGGNFPLLSRWGSIRAVEVSGAAVELSRRKYKDIDVFCVDAGSVLPFPDNSFDLIVLLDVLEHIEDDLQILSDLKPLLNEHGRLLLTVPAHPWLWSSHDEVLMHFRRYTVSDLRNKLQAAGFRIDYLTYFMFWLCWPLILYRLAARVLKFGRSRQPVLYPPLPGWLNLVAILLMRVEALWLKRSSLPFGTSVFVLASKIVR